jgi:TfoX/Sxy family transcriptional regulator of competence genes
MAYDEGLADRIRSQLGRQSGLSERKMFGGIGFMIGGNMVAGVSGDDLMLRIGPERHDEALSRPGARVFDMTGRPMKGWLLVSRSAVSTDDSLTSWLDDALDFARALPAKDGAARGRPTGRKSR